MRVTTSKSKNSESFYINRSFIDKNGKNTSVNYKKLGTLKELSEKLGTDRDGVMAWAKEQARIATLEYKKENEPVLLPLDPNRIVGRDEDTLFNSGYLFLQSIYYDLRIDNICRNIRNRHRFKYDINAILSDLIYARFLEPCSKRATYQYCQTLLEKPSYAQEDVYRALSCLAQESDYIQAELYRNSNFIHKRNTKILYYDCTNFYFEIEQEDDIKKYGKSKEHRPNPIVGMGLFMDTDGYPLAFDIYPGNQNEQLSLNPLEQKIINDFGCSEFIYCSDSGLGSVKNKLLNTTGNRGYVIAKSLKKLKKKDRETALDPAQYRKVGNSRFINLKNLDEDDPEVYESIYYKEIPLDSASVDEVLIVTYSPKYRKYQKSIRDKQIERAQKMIDSKGKMKRNRKNPNDPARFVRKHHCTENGEAAEEEYCELDQEAIDKEAMYDGFYGVVTNLDADISEIISVNKRRWQIEECFRLMKTDFKARPIYVRLEERIKAHFLTCFMALLFLRIIETKLDHKYTASEIIAGMRQIKHILKDGYGYIPAYGRTNLTDSLHESFGFRTDYEIIKKAKMRNIISSTKKRKKIR